MLFVVNRISDGIDGIDGIDGGSGICRIDGIGGIDGNLNFLWRFLYGDIDSKRDGDVDGIGGILLNGKPDIVEIFFGNFPETVIEFVDTSVV